MNRLQWVVTHDPPVDAFIGPPKPVCCVKGGPSHRWLLDIEQGHLGLTTDECRLCNDGIEDIEQELLGGSFHVELAFHRKISCGEIDVWFEVSPETKVPGD